MTFTFAFRTAFRGITRKKSRTALTVLGIVIGIMSIILIQSAGAGAQELILGQIRGLGSRTVFVEPGREPQGPSDFSAFLTDSLKDRELNALLTKQNVPDLEDMTPFVMIPGRVSAGSETTQATTIGTSELFGTILDIFPDQGVYFSTEDIQAHASVALIGDTVREHLFGESDGMGEKIKMKGHLFKVIGVFPKKGQVAMIDVDHSVIVPYTTAQQYLSGTDYYQALMGRATTEALLPTVVDDISRTLRDLHQIDDSTKDDFHVVTQVVATERVKTITDVLTALLSSIAAISLLVGGIGIMNIMLVSVSERTREIGLRKALGATNGNILFQFLLEALLLTSLGGVIGILFGAGFSFLISLALTRFVSLNWTFTFPVSAAVLGLVVSATAGIVFGLYPAHQASRKSPMEALRYE